ncbi:argininosuccinate lyase [Parvularcula bermudensis]|nr:argininosuccinate lyase [Parvularcula bermudensis]
MASDPKTPTNTMWGGRFSVPPAEIMEKFNASIGFDQKLARQDIEGSRAHARMLARQGILSEADREAILSGLDQVETEIAEGRFVFSTALEDIHMNVEGRLKELIGEAAGRLHTGRSRNDQVATDIRLWVRESLEAIASALLGWQGALVDLAEAHVDTVMPGFTHLQPATPVTFAHHLLAYVEMADRDRGRILDAKARANECPLGAAALAGTSHPIDRDQTAKALGFDRPMGNSIDAVSARDFALEAMNAAALAAITMSRFAEEVVIWSTPQFGFVRSAEAFSTGSSIMPQKRNPDAAELLRGKTGRVIGAWTSLAITMKGLPLAYSKDMQEDKEPLFDALDTVRDCLAIAAGLTESLEVFPDAMAQAASLGHTTAVDLADWLVRHLNLPFREAHHVVGALVSVADREGVQLHELSDETLMAAHPRLDGSVRAHLSPTASVAARDHFGGPAPAQSRARIATWKERLASPR